VSTTFKINRSAFERSCLPAITCFRAVLRCAALVVRRFLQLDQYVATVFAKYGQPGGLVRDGFGQVNFIF
jgi:hypothetical protein